MNPYNPKFTAHTHISITHSHPINAFLTTKPTEFSADPEFTSSAIESQVIPTPVVVLRHSRQLRTAHVHAGDAVVKLEVRLGVRLGVKVHSIKRK